MNRLLSFGLVLLAVAMTTAACTREDPFLPTDPTPVTPTTDTFSGTITRNGATTHDFAVNAAGSVTATLTTVTDPELMIGLALGTWNGTSCQLVIVNDRAKQGLGVVGQTSSFGRLCVRIYDVGNITTPVDYEVAVVHP